MSAQPDSAAPTPDTLEDAFSALDTAPELVDQHGNPMPFTNAAPEAQPVEVAPQEREAAAPDANEQQPGESDIDYKARVAELEQQIANREWSSQGRYLQEKAKREALESEIKRLREGYTSEDDRLRALYNSAIAQAEDPLQRENLELKRDHELSQRQAQRRQQQEEAERQSAEAERQAGQQVANQFHVQTMRESALPELLEGVANIAKALDLPDDEVRVLRAAIDNPQTRRTIEHAPPEFLAQFYADAGNYIRREAQAAQARVVARNREQASVQGTYRGPVNTAVAPPQPVRGRDVTKSSTEDLADAFFSDLSPTG